ncbi:MAG: hypothetical protein H7Y86_13060 [Rhizobacter sp.]|nr:hypothetical protein [Ferruginibacter sp.]
MNLPGFTAGPSLQRTTVLNKNKKVIYPHTAIIPQCSWYKRLGCTFGPFSWCSLASLGGAKPFWDCVAGSSNGECLECITAQDPREPTERVRDEYGEYEGNGEIAGYRTHELTSVNGVTVAPPPPGRERWGTDAALDEINRRLSRIERCACPLPVSIYRAFPYSPYMNQY